MNNLYRLFIYKPMEPLDQHFDAIVKLKEKYPTKYTPTQIAFENSTMFKQNVKSEFVETIELKKIDKPSSYTRHPHYHYRFFELDKFGHIYRNIRLKTDKYTKCEISYEYFAGPSLINRIDYSVVDTLRHIYKCDDDKVVPFFPKSTVLSDHYIIPFPEFMRSIIIVESRENIDDLQLVADLFRCDDANTNKSIEEKLNDVFKPITDFTNIEDLMITQLQYTGEEWCDHLYCKYKLNFNLHTTHLILICENNEIEEISFLFDETPLKIDMKCVEKYKNSYIIDFIKSFEYPNIEKYGINMSFIENIILNIKFKNEPDKESNNILNIHGINLNILRYLDGQVGLAYSN
jgi:hypothetical protein